ncbi:MAG: sortase [Rubrobacteraceae bacterium]
MRLRKLAFFLSALAVVVGLTACNSIVQSGGDEEGRQQEEAQPAPTQGNEESGGDQANVAEAPEDETLALTIPKLDKQIDNIPTERGDNIEALTNNAAVHLLYTGFPWEEEANVYLAGHVEGYEGTPSYNAFEGIGTLESGDEIIVTDANGSEYTYEVFEKAQVPPTAVEYLDPIPDKNIVTLQTCELVRVLPDGTPDYSNTDRLIVRGELVRS